MKINQILIIALFPMLLFGCANSEPNSNAVDKTSVPPVEEKVPEPAKKRVEPEVSYPKESYSQTSPTEAFKTYIMATVNRDVEAVKNSISKGSLIYVVTNCNC